MYSKEYLGRHGGRATGLALAVIVAFGATIGAAKADIRPDAGSELGRAIFASQNHANDPAPAPAPTVAAPAQPVVAIAFAAPVPGYAINSNFGVRRLPEEGSSRMHEGVDIAAPTGTAIHATASGRVASAGVSESYGRFVEVDHGEGVTTFYAHMSRSARLRAGDLIASGQVVGYVGSTGHSTGPHLHFEVRRNGLHFDPTLFVGKSFASYDALPFLRSAEHGFGGVRARVWKTSGKSRFKVERRAGGRVGTTIRAR